MRAPCSSLLLQDQCYLNIADTNIVHPSLRALSEYCAWQLDRELVGKRFETPGGKDDSIDAGGNLWTILCDNWQTLQSPSSPLD